MVDVKGLKGLIIAKGFKQKDIYERLGLTRRQWYLRLEAGKLDSDEMYEIKAILGDECIPIFFASQVTY